MKHRNKQKEKEEAKKQIVELFERAASISHKDLKLANSYVSIARKISLKIRVMIPRELKRKFCKNCQVFFIPSKNLRVRTTGKHILYYCLECKHQMRFPYVKERKEKRKKMLHQR